MYHDKTFSEMIILVQDGGILHLNIVLSDGDEEGNYLVVHVTTWREANGQPLRWQDGSEMEAASLMSVIILL
jgi:hypothetical protein